MSALTVLLVGRAAEEEVRQTILAIRTERTVDEVIVVRRGDADHGDEPACTYADLVLDVPAGIDPVVFGTASTRRDLVLAIIEPWSRAAPGWSALLKRTFGDDPTPSLVQLVGPGSAVAWCPSRLGGAQPSADPATFAERARVAGGVVRRLVVPLRPRRRVRSSRRGGVDTTDVLHVVRNHGMVSEGWLAEGMTAAADTGWMPWLAVTGRVMPEADPRRTPDRKHWLPTVPVSRARQALDRGTLRTSADRTGAGLIEPANQLQPAVIHAHFGWTAAEARRAAAAVERPLVVTFHGSDLTSFPGRRRAWDYRRVLSEAAEVITVSEFLARKLLRFGFDGRATVIPMGLDLTELPVTPPRVDAPPHVLYVGRLVEFKGADVLIEAAARARARVPGLHVDIVGEGPLRARCEKLVARHRLDKVVALHGARPRAEVRERLRAAPVVAIPSRTAQDGQAEGRSVLAMEAMAAGAMVVATDNGGLPETIPPELRHELARDGDPGSLGDALVQRLSVMNEWPDRAALCRGWVERRFAWPVLGQQIADVYARVSRQ